MSQSVITFENRYMSPLFRVVPAWECPKILHSARSSERGKILDFSQQI